MKVLLISHTCQSRTEGQPRAAALAQFPDIELRLLVPQRFNHYGTWREAEPPQQAEYSWQARRIVWPWLGPAQNYLHWYPSLAGIIREFQPDVIDLWEETWSLASAHACRLRNRMLPRAKIIAETEQNLDKTLPPPFEQLRSYVLRNADFCIGRSDEAVRVLRDKGYNGPAATIPNAVDAELFRPMNRTACRRDLQLNGFLVGYVGRLVEEKGVTDMVDAMPECSDEVTLLFAGDGPLRRELQHRAEKLGVAQRVHFLPHRPLQELPALMNALDVLVLPSRTTPRWKEQFGRVIIEAHACGTPVIGSDSGAIPAVAGEGGLIVPERDPLALSTAIEKLRNDSLQRKLLGQRGRQQVQEHCTWQRVAEQLRDVYLSTLSSD